MNVKSNPGIYCYIVQLHPYEVNGQLQTDPSVGICNFTKSPTPIPSQLPTVLPTFAPTRNVTSHTPTTMSSFIPTLTPTLNPPTQIIESTLFPSVQTTYTTASPTKFPSQNLTLSSYSPSGEPTPVTGSSSQASTNQFLYIGIGTGVGFLIILIALYYFLNYQNYRKNKRELTAWIASEQANGRGVIFGNKKIEQARKSRRLSAIVYDSPNPMASKKNMNQTSDSFYKATTSTSSRARRETDQTNSSDRMMSPFGANDADLERLGL